MPSYARPSPHVSSGWASGANQVARAASLVLLCARRRRARGRGSERSAKSRSRGAEHGIAVEHDDCVHRSTAHFGGERPAAPGRRRRAAIGSLVEMTWLRDFPRAAFMANPSACTAGGCRSPTMTSVDPRAREARSCATACTKRTPSPAMMGSRRSSAGVPGSAAAPSPGRCPRCRPSAGAGGDRRVLPVDASACTRRHRDGWRIRWPGDAPARAHCRAWWSDDRHRAIEESASSDRRHRPVRGHSAAAQAARTPMRRRRACWSAAATARSTCEPSFLGGARGWPTNQAMHRRRAGRLEQQSQSGAAVLARSAQAFVERAPTPRQGGRRPAAEPGRTIGS